ncbi:MAG TPA: endo-1,4-beta-xylanase [Tepidisphaeraceae bacterium]|jgi:hypothetical protein|nr:endo-1,4-beta-xylanase [Tepidisphaeraceae bacterium]
MLTSLFTILIVAAAYLVMINRVHVALPAVTDEMRLLADGDGAVSALALQGSQTQLGSVQVTEHDLMDVLGQDVMVDWYKLAQVADRERKLYLNDFGIFDSGLGQNAHQDHFFETLETLQTKGTTLDGIGIRSRIAADAPPSEALQTLDRFSTLGLPIESTELSINFEDRQLQADYLRGFMTALLSHPNVEGVMLWGFWSGRHWRPDAALWARDWTKRPIGQAFPDLLDTTWTTKASSLTADANGQAQVRGFLGAYDVTVTTPDGRTMTAMAGLTADGATVNVVVGAAVRAPTSGGALAAMGASEVEEGAGTR